MIGRNCVEDEIERPAVPLHLVDVARNDDLVRAEAQRVLRLAGRGVNTSTCAPKARASFVPMWPSPPNPTIPTLLPAPTPARRSGEYVVIPAHSSEAAPAGSSFDGTRSTKRSSTTMLSEYPPNVIGAVAVDRAECQRLIGIEVFEAFAAVGTGVVGVDQATDRDEIADLMRGDSGADLGDATDDLVARHAGIHRRQHIGPFIVGIVQVRVADAAEQDLYLHVTLGRRAARDRRERQRRRCARGT